MTSAEPRLPDNAIDKSFDRLVTLAGFCSTRGWYTKQEVELTPGLIGCSPKLCLPSGVGMLGSFNDDLPPRTYSRTLLDSEHAEASEEYHECMLHAISIMSTIVSVTFSTHRSTMTRLLAAGNELTCLNRMHT